MNQEDDIIQRMASLGTVAASLAHEIKNPLVSIKTLAQLLPEKYDDPEFRDYFTRIVLDEVERINTLVSELLDFARSSEPRMELLGLEDLIEEVLKRLSVRMIQGDIRMKKEFSSPRPTLYGDPVQLKQALLNIMVNGIESMPLGGELGVRVFRQGTEVVIVLSDTGCGIPAEDLLRIFEPFYTTKPSGTGLGLAICKKVVEEHGGKIHVTSRNQEGTVFTLSLPAAEGSEGQP